MTLPAYDPGYAQQLREARGYIPAAADGLTHHLSPDGTHPLCGAPDGTRLTANWQLINCGNCRTWDDE